jgi:repressor LexA
VSPSYEEMKDSLNLKSKSGIHRLISALEERGFIKRLAHKARALEVVKLPENASANDIFNSFTPSVIKGGLDKSTKTSTEVSVLGTIAAGTPIEAIQQEVDRVALPENLQNKGEHYGLRVKGDSMIEAGINDGDTVIVQKTNIVENGQIAVVLIDDQEATLKRVRKKGNTIALEAANKNYGTKIYAANRIKVQGKLVSLYRNFH